MIDIKELRIGNYVLPKNDSGAKSVMGVVFAFNDYLVSVDKNHNPYDFHLLEPVSLTEELLLKNGFNKINQPNVCSFFSMKKIGEITIDIYDDHSTIGNNTRIPHIKYLHQLQNLYFDLTGKELNVEL